MSKKNILSIDLELLSDLHDEIQKLNCSGAIARKLLTFCVGSINQTMNCGTTLAQDNCEAAQIH